MKIAELARISGVHRSTIHHSELREKARKQYHQMVTEGVPLIRTRSTREVARSRRASGALE
jgi:hypothetical protein